MKWIKYYPRLGEYITEKELFKWVGARAQELLDLDSKHRRLFEDTLGEFVIIKGKHYKVFR